MARFTLAPVELEDFRTGSGTFPFTAELSIDAAALGAELTGPTPLSWCRPLRRVTANPRHHLLGTPLTRRRSR